MSRGAPHDLPAIPNLRDVGGHETSDGGRVRTGLLYRSVALSHISDADLAALTELGVDTVFDLRTAAERDRNPDLLPAGARHRALDVLADSGEVDPAAFFALMQDPPRASAELADGGTERFYVASYHDMVRVPSARAAYGQLFRALAQDETGRALVHCTTGKDRTGWAVAVLLLFLGVDTEAVVREYLLSDVEVRAAYRTFMDEFVAGGGSREVIEPLMSVRRDYLEAALEVMDERYGSVGAYLADGLQLDEVTLGSLRRRFL